MVHDLFYKHSSIYASIVITEWKEVILNQVIKDH